MRYSPLPASVHQANRRRLAKALEPGALAIIDTADVLRRRGDFEYPFRPDSDFYYLTGIDESEAVLILAPDHRSPQLREIVCLRKTNEFMALWEGQRLDKAEATQRSGIQTVLWLDELPDLLERLVSEYHTLYLNAEPTLGQGPLGPSARRAVALRTQLPLHQFKAASTIIGLHRGIKSLAEIAQIRRAIEITGQGLAKAWAALTPGVPEYVLEAELTAEFMRRGATGSAFGAIIATGKNATVIHYAPGTATVAAGDLVLFDVGAEYGYYAADISRTVPAGGHFSDRQRAIYEVVYRAQATGIELHRPGTTLLEIDEAMRRVLLDGLVDLGKITRAQARGAEAEQHLRKYYAHISHHLGLDPHDTGHVRQKLEPGMVVTCEPGLYLQEEGIGVRLEDVVLITKTGHEVLSAGIPSAPADIEAAVQGARA